MTRLGESAAWSTWLERRTPASNLVPGDRVRAGRDREIGTVRGFVLAPKPERWRALVTWDSDGCDQFVDVDKLVAVPYVWRFVAHIEPWAADMVWGGDIVSVSGHAMVTSTYDRGALVWTVDAHPTCAEVFQATLERNGAVTGYGVHRVDVGC